MRCGGRGELLDLAVTPLHRADPGASSVEGGGDGGAPCLCAAGHWPFLDAEEVEGSAGSPRRLRRPAEARGG
jgi:hypothetical protein